MLYKTKLTVPVVLLDKIEWIKCNISDWGIVMDHVFMGSIVRLIDNSFDCPCSKNISSWEEHSVNHHDQDDDRWSVIFNSYSYNNLKSFVLALNWIEASFSDISYYVLSKTCWDLA